MQAAHELRRVGVAVAGGQAPPVASGPHAGGSSRTPGVVEDPVLVAGVAGRLPEVREHRIELGELVRGQRGRHFAGPLVAGREPAILDEGIGGARTSVRTMRATTVRTRGICFPVCHQPGFDRPNGDAKAEDEAPVVEATRRGPKGHSPGRASRRCGLPVLATDGLPFPPLLHRFRL